VGRDIRVLLPAGATPSTGGYLYPGLQKNIAVRPVLLPTKIHPDHARVRLPSESG